MPFNGSGTFTKAVDWATESASPPVSISNLDTSEADIATGLSNCITKDGQTTITAAIPFNDKRITGLGNASADADALNRITADGRYGAKSSGSFTGALTGYASSPTGTVKYVIVGGFCTLYLDASITGTSNSGTMTMTGLPSACQPAASRTVTCVTRNQGFDSITTAVVSSSTVEFFNGLTIYGSSTFNGTGTKGLPAGCVIMYPL